MCIQTLGVVFKSDSDMVDPRWDLRLCISNHIPGNAKNGSLPCIRATQSVIPTPWAGPGSLLKMLIPGPTPDLLNQNL